MPKVKKPREPVHANRYDTLTWCDARTDWVKATENLAIIGAGAPAEDLSEVTCEACLTAIVLYGQDAAQRLQDLTK